MDIPVDGVVVHSSGLLTNESAMTGESEELKKESLHHCFLRKAEKEEDDNLTDGKLHKMTPHDLPSPVLLSGTQI